MSGRPTASSARLRGLLAATMLLAGLEAKPAEGSWSSRDPLDAMPTRPIARADLKNDGKAVSCVAQVGMTQVLSLEDAVGFALCHNAQLNGAWAAVAVQAGALGEAGAAFLPTLRASFGEVRNRTAYPNGGGDDRSLKGRTAQWSLGFRLFDFGARTANRDAAGALLSAASARQDAVLQSVMASVVGSYFEAVTSQSVLRARMDAVDMAQRTRDVVLRREALGAAASNDSLQAATSHAKATLAATRAQGEAGKATATLAYAMGADAEQTFRLPDVMERPTASDIGELANWLIDLQVRHPAIIAARARLAAAELKVVAVAAEGLPTIDLSASHYRNGYPNQSLPSTRTDTTSLGVTLTLPLFEGFGRHYQVMGAQAESEQERAALLDTVQKAAMELSRAHAEATAAWASLDASQTLLTAATHADESAQRRYAKGAADVLELLTSQAARADAQLESIRSLFQWHATRLQLLAFAGRIGTFR